MNPALWAAKTGLDAQQTRLAVISQQPRQRQHHGLQDGPRGVRGPAVPERRARSAARRRRTRSAPTGLNLGTGVRVVATEKNYTQGDLDADRQSARRGHQRPRLLPDPDARRHAGLHARRHVPDQRAGTDGDLAAATRCSRGITIPTARSASRSASTASSSARAAGQSTPVQVGTLQLTDFVNPAGLQPRGENLYLETAASGPPQTGTPGLNGLGTVDAGLARNLQRQRGRGAGQHDRDAARLRDELAGDRDQPTRCSNT